MDPLTLMGCSVLFKIVSWIVSSKAAYDRKKVLEEIGSKICDLEKFSNKNLGKTQEILEQLSKREEYEQRKERKEKLALMKKISSRVDCSPAHFPLSSGLQLALSALLYFLHGTIIHFSVQTVAEEENDEVYSTSILVVGGLESDQCHTIDCAYKFVGKVRAANPYLRTAGPLLVMHAEVCSESTHDIENEAAYLLALNFCHEIVKDSPFPGAQCHVRLVDVDAGEQMLPKIPCESNPERECEISITVSSRFPWGDYARSKLPLAPDGLEDTDIATLDEFHEYVDNMLVQQSIKHIYIIGPTGAGKSTIGNILCGDNDTFSTSLTETGTTLPAGIRVSEGSCLYHSDINLMVWDTPGLDDANGRDEVFLHELKHRLIKVQTASAILFCVRNPNRNSGSLQKALQMYKEIFGPRMAKVLKVIITESGVRYSQEEKKRIRVAWVRNVRKTAGLIIDRSAVLFFPIAEAPKLPFIPKNLSLRESHSLRTFQSCDDFVLNIPRGLTCTYSPGGNVQSTNFEYSADEIHETSYSGSTETDMGDDRILQSTHLSEAECVLRGLVVDIWIAPNILTAIAEDVYNTLGKWHNATSRKEHEKAVEVLRSNSRKMLSHIHSVLSMGSHRRAVWGDEGLQVVAKHVTRRKRIISLCTLGIVNHMRKETVCFVFQTPEMQKSVQQKYIDTSNELPISGAKKQKKWRAFNIVLLEDCFNELGLIICKVGSEYSSKDASTIMMDAYMVMDPEERATEETIQRLRNMAESMRGHDISQKLCEKLPSFEQDEQRT